jgi:hypothetical protein
MISFPFYHCGASSLRSLQQWKAEKGLFDGSWQRVCFVYDAAHPERGRLDFNFRCGEYEDKFKLNGSIADKRPGVA